MIGNIFEGTISNLITPCHALNIYLLYLFSKKLFHTMVEWYRCIHVNLAQSASFFKRNIPFVI